MAHSEKAAVDLSVVVPVYQEEDNVEPFLRRTTLTLSRLTQNYEIIFCLDPSADQTEALILKACDINKRIKLLKFSRRFGQPAATMAGILNALGAQCVIIDIDLQDPPEVIKDLVDEMQKGFDVVYAKRISRSGETFIKKMVTKIGYKLMNRLSDVQIPRDTGDFRIISRRVIEELRGLNETHGFLRGLVAYVGFSQTFIEYEREKRYSGKGNYNRFVGSIKIGLNGIIGFSSKPLNLMAIVGALIAVMSFFLGIWYWVQNLMGVAITAGLSTTVILVTFFAGIQLLSLGLLGEYVSRIYDEVKRRPMYIIENKKNFDV
jgi:glycosyltransferase involved in cell wall biosynthesis